MSELRRQGEHAARGGLSIRAQLDRLIDRMLGRHKLAAALFLGADGKVSAQARAWLDDMARHNFVTLSTFVSGDRERTLINEGRRQLALEILASVHFDQARLDELLTKKKEIEDGGR